MYQKLMISLVLIFLVLPGGLQAGNGPDSGTTPRALRPDISVELFLAVENDCIRIEKNPATGQLYYARISGSIYEIDVNSRSKRLIAAASDHGINSVAGLAVASDGTFYLVGNLAQGGMNTGIIKRGQLQGESLLWTTVAETVPYPLNIAFNHNFNAIAISPDGQYLYVNSGARTDHGEAQHATGSLAGLREFPLTSCILRLPLASEGVVLENDEASLSASGYLFARGVRNHFDLAFAANGDLFGVENSGDRDDSEELNWLRQGYHYGFPWRMGTNDTPQQFPGYDPAQDPLVSSSSYAAGLGFFHDDPTYPPPPQGLVFMDPVPNVGPDGDKYRQVDGLVQDASDNMTTTATFTAHRSPLGLVFDVDSTLSDEFRGDAFMLSFGTGSGALGDPGNDLLHLKLTKSAEAAGYSVSATQIVEKFNGGRFDRGPVDAVLLGRSLYVLETGAPNLWKITLPTRPTSVAETSKAPTTFSLEQNFPNPFNPATRIEFHLPDAGPVSLRIYNLRGHVVATVMDSENLVAGRHSRAVDLSGLSSGIYFYSLEQASRKLVRKLTLLR